MGNYISEIPVLIEILQEDAKTKGSTHDFGKDVILFMLRKGLKIFSYDFTENKVPGEEQMSWRDVRTIKPYWEANMDLLSIKPELNLYNDYWPLRTTHDFTPPAKCVFRQLLMDNSIISGGCIITEGELSNSILCQWVAVEKKAQTIESVIFANVQIGESARVKKEIIDKDVKAPPYTRIGYDIEEDEARGFRTSDELRSYRNIIYLLSNYSEPYLKETFTRAR